jgi:hypothetical protein
MGCVFFGSRAAQLRQTLADVLPIPEQRPVGRNLSAVSSLCRSTLRRPDLLQQQRQGFMQMDSHPGGIGKQESALSNKASRLDSRAASRLFSTSCCVFPWTPAGCLYNRSPGSRNTLLRVIVRSCMHGSAFLATPSAPHRSSHGWSQPYLDLQKTCPAHQFQASAAFQHPSAGMPR